MNIFDIARNAVYGATLIGLLAYGLVLAADHRVQTVEPTLVACTTSVIAETGTDLAGAELVCRQGVPS